MILGEREGGSENWKAKESKDWKETREGKLLSNVIYERRINRNLKKKLLSGKRPENTCFKRRHTDYSPSLSTREKQIKLTVKSPS